jgi:hypothetical protein
MESPAHIDRNTQRLVLSSLRARSIRTCVFQAPGHADMKALRGWRTTSFSSSVAGMVCGSLHHVFYGCSEIWRDIEAVTFPDCFREQLSKVPFGSVIKEPLYGRSPRVTNQYCQIFFKQIRSSSNERNFFRLSASRNLKTPLQTQHVSSCVPQGHGGLAEKLSC